MDVKLPVIDGDPPVRVGTTYHRVIAAIADLDQAERAVRRHLSVNVTVTIRAVGTLTEDELRAWQIAPGKVLSIEREEH